MYCFIALLLLCIAGVSKGQEHECVYKVNTGEGNEPYMLNLTTIQDWRFERKEDNGFSYYYTPCRNGLECSQGNANFYGNTAQYRMGENDCLHYLSVDHHEEPFYSPGGASIIFTYEDGELCQQTNEPRRTSIVYQCAENAPFEAILVGVDEPELCHYIFNIESPLACIPENRRNANCQFQASTSSGKKVSLDLSPLKRLENPLRFIGYNGYRVYLTPCQNGLHCYQQAGTAMAQSVLDNSETGTCERWLSVWEDGRHQPSYTKGEGLNDESFNFRFYNGQSCQSGNDQYISEERITYICDRKVNLAQTINVTRIGLCRIDYFVASSLACVAEYDKYGNLKRNKKKLYEKVL